MNLGNPVSLFVSRDALSSIRSVTKYRPNINIVFILLDIVWPIKQNYESREINKIFSNF